MDKTYAGSQNENYRLDAVVYDKNSNIKSLVQRGFKGNGTYDKIDELTFNFTHTYGNKLSEVSDAQGISNSDVSDFRDRSSGSEYDYWADGSLKKDLNKEITGIDYNYLNLTSQITLSGSRVIYYRRDGAGAKIRKENSAGSTWDYVGECIYLNGQLYQLAHSEGRITYEGSYRYEFQYKDHLGNLRLAFRDSAAAPISGVYAPPVIVQINNYLPFGGRAVGLDYELTNKDQYTYGSKERQDDFGINIHDFEARMSDPTIGNRFLSQDVLSETSRRFSPYLYAFNNPIRFIDPDGMQTRYNWGSGQYYNDNNKDGYLNNDEEGTSSNTSFSNPDDVQFDEKGNYLRTVKDGSNEYTGSIRDGDGNVISRFNFNDQKTAKELQKGDKLQIEFEKTFVTLLFEKAQILNSVNLWNNPAAIWSWAAYNSLAGNKLDFVGKINQDYKIYLAGNYAYDLFDAGNFMWGMAMRTLGFSYSSVKVGSETNAFFLGKRQNGAPTIFNFITLTGDSKEDQNAIRRGYFFNFKINSYKNENP